MQKAFSNAFYWMAASEFEIAFQRNMPINWKYASTGSGNGLSPDCQQAITWKNVDQEVWCHLASKGQDESQCELFNISLKFYICFVVSCFLCIQPTAFTIVSFPLKHSHKTTRTGEETVKNIGQYITWIKKAFHSTKPNQCNTRPFSYTQYSSYMFVESTTAHFINDTTENMERVLHSMIVMLRKGESFHRWPDKNCLIS